MTRLYLLQGILKKAGVPSPSLSKLKAAGKIGGKLLGPGLFMASMPWGEELKRFKQPMIIPKRIV